MQAGAALVGGETAEMPGMYHGEDYDLAGFCVGVVEKEAIIDGTRVAAGDAIIGLASSGAHSNGYSLIRKLIAAADASPATMLDGRSLFDRLLAPTRIYVKPLLALDACACRCTGWRTSPAAASPTTSRACCRTGMEVVLRARAAGRATRCLTGCSTPRAPTRPRCIAPSTAASAWSSLSQPSAPTRRSSSCGRAARARRSSARSARRPRSRHPRMSARTPLRLAILISGRGTNMLAIARACQAGAIAARVTLVHLRPRRRRRPRQRAGTRARDRHGAARAGARAVRRSSSASPRPSTRSGPDVIALAGFMRILSAPFVERYLGRMLNIHPSILPAYRGLHTHRRVLEAGDAWHGASVHFVTPELDGGPVVLQSRVPVQPGDTESTLSARVQASEYIIYPRVLGWFAQGRLTWQDDAAWLDGKPLVKPAGGGLRCTHQLTRSRYSARPHALVAGSAAGPVRRAPSVADELKPFDASYEWSWHGMTVAVSSVKLEKSGDTWTYTSNSEPRGLGKMFSERPHMVSVLKMTPIRRPAAELQGHRRHLGRQARRRSQVRLDEPQADRRLRAGQGRPAADP